MDATLRLRCINNGKTYEAPEGCNLLEAYRLMAPALKYRAVSAKVNNRSCGLKARLFHNSDVEFLDITDNSGMRTYTRTLFFVLAKAVEDLYEGVHISVEASVSNGYYVSLRHVGDTRVDVGSIRQRMDSIIAADLPIVREETLREDAVKVFEGAGMASKAKLLRSVTSLYTTYFTLDGYPGYFFSDMCPSTGYVALYGLEPYHEGMLLRLPDPAHEGELMPVIKQEKMLEVFNENHRWQDLVGLRTIGDLNEECAKGHINDIINVSEALQEKRICQIAEAVKDKGSVRIVLISGPSSSGKTTFSKRLSVQLMASGLRPRPISMDEYFLRREDTPRDADGKYDFESIHALNLPLLADHLQKMLAGEEVELPHYDFQSGESVSSGNKVRLQPDDVLVMEGIHALNPELTKTISDALKFKIYVSALTTIQLDNQNCISTTDNRLLRRIVRDHKYRGYSAVDTISRWPSVGRGERKWIFPYQEEADAMFNSALLFELAGLRTQALPLLEQVPENCPEYSEAHRLTKFLKFINPIDTSDLPPVSLLREFMGGSSFKY